METVDFKNLYKEIVTKAWKDDNFKKELLNSPHEAIRKFTDRSLDFDGKKKIIVEDQTDKNKIYINLPQKLDFENMELSEEQLEKIAGGGFFDFFLALFVSKS